MRRSVGNHVLVRWILLLVWAGTPLISVAQQTAQAPTAAATPAYKPLTADRIYSEPSLNGRLTRGVAWTPDSKQISFFESNATGKVGRTELWAVDVASGQRRGARDGHWRELGYLHRAGELAYGLEAHCHSAAESSANGFGFAYLRCRNRLGAHGAE